MQITFKKEVDKKIRKLLEDLKEEGIDIEFPVEFSLDENQLHTYGKITPIKNMYVRVTLRGTVDESLIEVDKR